MSSSPLDNPVWESLSAHHAAFAVGNGVAKRYRRGVNSIGSVGEDTDRAWMALAAYADNDEVLYTGTVGARAMPSCWVVEREVPMLQMILESPIQRLGGEIEWCELGMSDAEEAHALAELTKPGPFERETLRLGRFIGVRVGGRLIAMAGERFRFPGFHEISGVCTHPDWQGRGLARCLMAELANTMQARGDIPFLHVVAENAVAAGLYERMGFSTRIEMVMRVIRRVQETP